MSRNAVKKEDSFTRISVRIPNDLLAEIKKDTSCISNYCRDAIADKIYKKKEEERMKMVDNFPCISIEENTTDLLRRYRNEE